MSNKNQTGAEIFDFPCDYPIKVFAKDDGGELVQTVCAIIEQYSGKLQSQQISKRHSAKGNYIALTVRIMAENRAQLDAINQALQSHPSVAYVL